MLESLRARVKRNNAGCTMSTGFRSLASISVLAAGLLACLVACVPQEPAQLDSPFRELSGSERMRLDAQRATADAAVKHDYGVSRLTRTKADLPVLQRAIDGKLFGATQTEELRSLGVAFGDVLASELPLRWVSMTDAFGAHTTLRFKDTPQEVNTLQMIEKYAVSRRRLSLQAELETIRKRLSQIDTTARPGGYLRPADVTKIVVWDSAAQRRRTLTGDDSRIARILSLYNAAERVAAPGETTNDYSIQFYTRAGLAAGVYFNAGDPVLGVQTPHGENLGIVAKALADIVREAAE